MSIEPGPETEPNPFAPPHTLPGAMRPASAAGGRPKAGTVFGIINIIFGVLGLISGPMNLANQYLMARSKVPNPVLDMLASIPGYATFNLVTQVLGFLTGAVLVASGIGLLQGRPFGRTLALGYAWYSFAMLVVSFAVFLGLLYRPLADLAANAKEPAVMIAAMGGLIGGFVGLLIGPIYPGLMLYFMTRPRVVAYYSRREPPAHGHLHTP